MFAADDATNVIQCSGLFGMGTTGYRLEKTYVSADGQTVSKIASFLSAPMSSETLLLGAVRELRDDNRSDCAVNGKYICLAHPSL